jgi:TonB family protein
MADVRAPLKNFQAPESRLARQSPSYAPAAPLPAAPETNTPAPNLAIAGLHPVLKPDFAPPPGSRPANFSAGPNPDPNGAASIPSPTSSSGTLVVPGLLVRGGEKNEMRPLMALNNSPTARENLSAAMRSAPNAPPESGDQNSAARLTSAPDRRMDGRAIYTMAIQMPNISSYSGSWLVWYAEHESRAGAIASEMHPPKPIRKVDPKYSPAAIDARIQGEVRLFAVIRKDGRVSSVAVVRGIDDRLDRSAAEALSKWEFEPAMYAGAPVDIDAVFEIPFHVAPPPPHRGR